MKTKKTSLDVCTLTVVLGAVSVLWADPARATWFVCQAKGVSERHLGGDRIQVACKNSIKLSGNTVSKIAISANAQHADRFHSLAMAAFLSGQRFWLDLPASSASNIPGCDPKDCRTPTMWGIGN